MKRLVQTIKKGLGKFFRAFGNLARSFFDATFLKYVIVGLSTTVVGAGLMYLLYNGFHVSYWFSSAANQIVASLLTFFLNKRVTFQVREWSVKLVFFYILNIAVCYVLAYGVAQPLARRAFTGMTITGQDNMAMLLGLIIYKILNYFGQRFFVFRKKLNRERPA